MSQRLSLLVADELQTGYEVNRQGEGLDILSSWAESNAEHLCKVYLPDLPLRLSRQAGEEVGRELRAIFQANTQSEQEHRLFTGTLHGRPRQTSTGSSRRTSRRLDSRG